jgi:hypothetical protein
MPGKLFIWSSDLTGISFRNVVQIKFSWFHWSKNEIKIKTLENKERTGKLREKMLTE